MTTEKLEPFTLEEWRKRPGDLRNIEGKVPDWSEEVNGFLVVKFPWNHTPIVVGEPFTMMVLAAPKPKLVEVRIRNDTDVSFIGAEAIIARQNDVPFSGWRTFYNLDTGEMIPRVGVEK